MKSKILSFIKKYNYLFIIFIIYYISVTIIFWDDVKEIKQRKMAQDSCREKAELIKKKYPEVDAFDCYCSYGKQTQKANCFCLDNGLDTSKVYYEDGVRDNDNGIIIWGDLRYKYPSYPKEDNYGYTMSFYVTSD